jgi:hypothetical protein
LIGVEPNPGPKKKTSLALITIGAKSASEVRNMVPARSGKKVKQKNKNANPGRISGMAARTGNLISAGRATDMALYAKCLANPFDQVPVRLGGETMQPSGIATLTLRQVLGVNSSGALSIVFYPKGLGGIFSSVSASSPYTYTSATSTFPGGSSLNGIATGGRIVAAGIRIMTPSSATTDNGLVTIGCLPRDAAGPGNDSYGGFPCLPSTTSTQGFNEFFNYLSTETYPLRCGASAVWRPEDPIDFTFRNYITNTPTSTTGQNVPLCPFFVVGVSGAAASSTVLVEFIAHIEYTVNEGTVGVIDTGMGDMTSVDSFDVAKKVVGTLVDTSFMGVSQGLTKAATAAGQMLIQQIGSYFGSTAAAT